MLRYPAEENVIHFSFLLDLPFSKMSKTPFM